MDEGLVPVLLDDMGLTDMSGAPKEEWHCVAGLT